MTVRGNRWKFVAVVVASAFLATCRQPVDDSRPNVILILLDTLRADHLHLYGYPEKTAPFLTRLGEQSAVFLNAFSTSSWTPPATASLFTGEYPARHGVTQGFFAHQELMAQMEKEGRAVLPLNRMSDALPTLPELLRQRGYATYGVAANMHIGPEMGFDRGFNRFKRKYLAPAEKLIARLLWWKRRILRSEPWFVYLHLNDVHAPFVPREPWYEEQEDFEDNIRAIYDSEIRYMDSELERVLHILDSDNEAVVVVVADHGEEFWERGELGHHFSLYYELNRIVLLVRGPGIEPAVIEENVTIIDVLPTVLELVDTAGGSIPSDGEMAEGPEPPMGAGISLAGLLRREQSPDDLGLAERLLFAHRTDFHLPEFQIWAAIRGRWKLIEGDRPSMLFDFVADPGEQTNLFDQQPEIAADLSAALWSFRLQERWTRLETDVTIDEEMLDHLRSLGYVAR